MKKNLIDGEKFLEKNLSHKYSYFVHQKKKKSYFKLFLKI